MAKMKIEALYHRQRAHGLAVPRQARSRTCRAGRRGRRACRGSPICATRFPARRGSAKRGSASRRGARCPRGGATRSCAARLDRATMRGGERGRRALRRHVHQLFRARERARGAAACCARRAIASTSLGRSRADAEPARPLCCGRTYLAAGLVDEAKAEARRVVAALLPHVERGAAIVGLEPSCLLSLRDEFLVMGLGEAAQRLGGQRVPHRGVPRARARAGRLALAACRRFRRSGRCCTRIATRRRSMPWRRRRRCWGSSRTSRSSWSNRAAAGWPGASATRRRTTMCRCGWPSLRSAGRARGGAGHAHRRRRHELPAPDRRSHARHRLREAMHVVRVLERALPGAR